MKAVVGAVALLSSSIYAQQPGSLTPENHPALSSQECTKSGCTTQQTAVVMDSNWRWTHHLNDATNCYTGNSWDSSACPDPVSCAKNCALDGCDYPGTYGVRASGNELTIGFVTHGPYSTNIGSRLYMMESNGQAYKKYKLKNREFTFDVDVSQLPCGLNGALYFVDMEADGGAAAHPGNKAGAKFGTGYCDAQCPHDIKFINGEANINNWTPDPTDPNSGKGQYGSCCAEMDIWEANSMSAAVTPHVCDHNGQYRCSGTECGDGANRYGGLCDKDGCDFNSWRMGNKTFIGAGSQFDVNTQQKMTVVTQFITRDNTDTGDLVEIKRIYKQNGRVIQNSMSTNLRGTQFNSVTDAFCTAQKTLFGDNNAFIKKGGLKKMGDAMNEGMVLVMSLWDDHEAHMLWLDSNYPTNASAATPGVARGPCPITGGVPADVERDHPNANVKFSNIKFGAIGSTF